MLRYCPLDGQLGEERQFRNYQNNNLKSRLLDGCGVQCFPNKNGAKYVNM